MYPLASSSPNLCLALFYFFPTKDALVVSLYIDIKSRVAAYMADKLMGKISLKEVLNEYYSATLHWALANSLEFRFIEQFNTSPYLKHIESDEIDKHVEPIFDLLRRGIADKVIKPIDVDIIFILIRGHTFGINNYLASKQLSEVQQDAVIQDTFELLWDMIT